MRSLATCFRKQEASVHGSPKNLKKRNSTSRVPPQLSLVRMLPIPGASAAGLPYVISVQGYGFRQHRRLLPRFSYEHTCTRALHISMHIYAFSHNRTCAYACIFRALLFCICGSSGTHTHTHTLRLTLQRHFIQNVTQLASRTLIMQQNTYRFTSIGTRPLHSGYQDVPTRANAYMHEKMCTNMHT